MNVYLSMLEYMMLLGKWVCDYFVGLACQGKDTVFRFYYRVQ